VMRAYGYMAFVSPRGLNRYTANEQNTTSHLHGILYVFRLVTGAY
jgi:hypothetical protein